MRALHARVVHNLVQIRTAHGAGSGWLLQQSGRPVVVTNKHVVRGVRRAEVLFYRGTENAPSVVRAQVFGRSNNVDLAVLRLDADPPNSARPHRMNTTTTVYRGERIVLGGNPGTADGIQLPFQTTFGVVTGHVSGNRYEQCGRGRNCVVVDAASLGGSSGGPAFNLRGELVGMLWGGPAQLGDVMTTRGPVRESAIVQNPSFAYLIHTRTLADELRRFERATD